MWLILIYSIAAASANRKHRRDHEDKFISSRLNQLKENDTIPGSVIGWDSVDTFRRFSLLSMDVVHNTGDTWYIPSLHERYSVGWNRTMQSYFLNQPHACGIQFYGLGLESTFKGYTSGGTGYITIHFKNEKTKYFWYGFDKNETNKLHCYYLTSKGYASEFFDTPKTLGVAVYCPVSLDAEVGEYGPKKVMMQGYYCRVLSEYVASVQINLRPSDFISPLNSSEVVSESIEISSKFVTVPSAARAQVIKEQEEVDPRPHAVCTVQTFCNMQSGQIVE